MFTQEIELRGHIIDSLTLPKVLDEILNHGGRFEILEIRIGKRRAESSYARVAVSAPTAEKADRIIRRLRQHGAEVLREAEVRLAEAPADGVFPEGFYVTSNRQTCVRVHDRWIEVQPVIMDCGIAVDPAKGRAWPLKFSEVRRGMQFAVGHAGIRMTPLERALTRENIFEFMASNVSSEKPKSATVRDLAGEMHRVRQAGEGKILVVGGPAVIHTGGGEHLARLIERGYVNVLFAGNALAVHDIEQALYGTSLGVSLEAGGPVSEGHENHMHAINAIRAAGGIARAVEGGLLRQGVMFQCVRRGVRFVLAGSIRDDGPLPDVITDVMEAQRAMRREVEGVALALMMGTMLHSVAVGNMLPATVRTFCVDINPAVVTKLTDRGTFQAVGLVTDLEPFLRELIECLDAMPKEVNPHAPPAGVPA